MLLLRPATHAGGRTYSWWSFKWFLILASLHVQTYEDTLQAARIRASQMHANKAPFSLQIGDGSLAPLERLPRLKALALTVHMPRHGSDGHRIEHRALAAALPQLQVANQMLDPVAICSSA